MLADVEIHPAELMPRSRVPGGAFEREFVVFFGRFVLIDGFEDIGGEELCIEPVRVSVSACCMIFSLASLPCSTY
ncbi:MAG: hypothetical protein QM811_19120 [Pirellulales bacterium]